MALFYHSLQHGVQKVISKNKSFHKSRWWVGLQTQLVMKLKTEKSKKKLSDLHKKILITGAGGFIGSRLFNSLKKKNYKVLELILIF